LIFIKYLINHSFKYSFKPFVRGSVSYGGFMVRCDHCTFSKILITDHWCIVVSVHSITRPVTTPPNLQSRALFVV